MNIITRIEAKNKGLKYYFTGKPCKRGHISKRLLSNGTCWECYSQIQQKWRENNPEYQREWYNSNLIHVMDYNKEYYENNLEYYKEYYKDNINQFIYNNKEYYKNNREYVLQRTNEYYKNNIEQILQNGKKWRENNPEYYIQQGKNWRENNPHKVTEHAKLRRTRLEQSIPCWYEEELVKQIYLKRDELNDLWGTNMVVDHIIPLNPRCGTVSGLHCWANLQLLDNSLNGSKGGKYETDW